MKLFWKKSEQEHLLQTVRQAFQILRAKLGGPIKINKTLKKIFVIKQKDSYQASLFVLRNFNC